jgi:hypothetical protein
MKYLVISLLLVLFLGCENESDYLFSNVFFYPCECDGSPIDYGYIKIYNEIDSLGDLKSFVDYINIDSEHAIMDPFNGLYYCYHISLNPGSYYVLVYSNVSKQSQVKQFSVIQDSNSITLKACK